MKLQRILRNYLRQHFPDNFRQEPWCSCGSANHARIILFRVDGEPATVIVPESNELTAAEVRRALPGAGVEPLSEAELDAVYAESELGRMQPFENPFGASVYLDAALLQFETLVFCPRMFGGRKGECFRIPTEDFVALTRAVALPLPLVPAFVEASHA